MSVKNSKTIVKQIIDVVSQWGTYAQNADVKTEYIEQIQKTLRLNL